MLAMRIVRVGLAVVVAVVLITREGGDQFETGSLRSLLLRVSDGDSGAPVTRTIFGPNATTAFTPGDRRVVENVTVAGGPPDASDTLTAVWRIDTGEPHVDWACLRYDSGDYRETVATKTVEAGYTAGCKFVKIFATSGWRIPSVRYSRQY
jgi:hypothetical protein